MAIALRLDTGDLRVAYDLLSGDTSLAPGTEVGVPGGARLRFARRVAEGRTPDGGRLEFQLTDATRATAEPLAGWLYDRLQRRVPTVHLGGMAVPVDLEALQRALVQAISEKG